MPTLIAGAVAVILLYLLLQMFRSANPVVLARAIKDRRRRCGSGGCRFTPASRVSLRWQFRRDLGAGLLGWSPFGASGFGGLSGMFGAGRATLAGPGVAGPFAVSRHEPRSRQRPALRPDRGRTECRPTRSTNFEPGAV